MKYDINILDMFNSSYYSILHVYVHFCSVCQFNSVLCDSCVFWILNVLKTQPPTSTFISLATNYELNINFSFLVFLVSTIAVFSGVILYNEGLWDKHVSKIKGHNQQSFVYFVWVEMKEEYN